MARSNAPTSYEIATLHHSLLRVLALLIDFCVVNAFVFVFYFAVGQSLVSTFLYSALIGLAYGICVEGFAKGVTLGLFVTNLRVVSLVEKRTLWLRVYRVAGTLLDVLPVIQWVAVPTDVVLAFINPRRIMCDMMGRTATVYKHSSLAALREAK